MRGRSPGRTRRVARPKDPLPNYSPSSAVARTADWKRLYTAGRLRHRRQQLLALGMGPQLGSPGLASRVSIASWSPCVAPRWPYLAQRQREVEPRAGKSLQVRFLGLAPATQAGL